VVRALRPTGELHFHRPCGSDVRPAPTLIGQELDGTLPFPEDVIRVVDRNGRELRRTPQGWALGNGTIRGLWVQTDYAPYLVMAVDPALTIHPSRA
jgi:hypothetical protein